MPLGPVGIAGFWGFFGGFFFQALRGGRRPFHARCPALGYELRQVPNLDVGDMPWSARSAAFRVADAIVTTPIAVPSTRPAFPLSPTQPARRCAFPMREPRRHCGI